ncbi:MAG: hypothetical protein JNK41_11915 [Saprospiraceae bacterium]|jgi:predicted nuclease with TOPRIM domain|nr:hypothetical protein [Saprospiraceae bacterium]
MQEELNTGYAKLEEKVLRLLQKYDELQKDNIELNNQIVKLKEENLLLTKKTINPTTTAQQSQIAFEFETKQNDNKRVKKEIESAVKKIEDCIDWLQKY